MTRIEAEWLVAWALVQAKVLLRHQVIRDTYLNVGKDLLMKKCPKCGREYYMDCTDCTFRNGGRIRENDFENENVNDAVVEINDHRYWRIANTLAWMGVSYPDPLCNE